MIGVLCEVSDVRASAMLLYAVCTPSAMTALPAVARTKLGSRVT
jgi:hypothetical protein